MTIGHAWLTISEGCQDLLDRAQKLLNEYKDDHTTPELRGQIIAELREIGSDWAAVCQQSFGPIVLVIWKSRVLEAETSRKMMAQL